MPLRAFRTIAFTTVTTLAALPGPTGAAAVFSDWTSVNTTPGSHRLTVNDTGNRFEWTLTVTPWNAEALGLFVDLGVVDMPADIAIDNLIASAPVTLAASDSTASSCGSGCNLNGLALPERAGGDWELVLRLGSTGFDGIQTYSWITSDFGLDEADIRLVGVRAQQLCSEGQTLSIGSAGNCGGSDKAYAWPASDRGPELSPPPSLFSVPPASTVPAPSTLALLLAAAGAGFACRRRRALRDHAKG